MNMNTNDQNSTRRTIIAHTCAILLAGSTLAIAACNTVEGAGKDIEATGDAISDTANDAKD